MRKIIQKNFNYWTHERSLTDLLIYLSISLFIWMPLSQNVVWEQLVHDLLFMLILLSGVFAVSSLKWQRYVFVGMALLAFFIRWLVFIYPVFPVKIAPSNLRKQFNANSMDEVFYKLARQAERNSD
ncbi:MAG: hypothetical protein ABIR06_17605 [Cyclobacteriaceae bacterium]